jgi:predicted metal-binding protein
MKSQQSGYIYLFKRIGDDSPVYIGQHNGRNKKYFTSSIRLNNLLSVNGDEWFWSYYKREIIHKDIASYTELNELEIKYIKKFNTYIGDNPKGYNYSRGGDGGDNWSNHPDKIKLRKKCIDGYKKTITSSPEIIIERVNKFKKTLQNNPNIIILREEKRRKTLQQNPLIIEEVKRKLIEFNKKNPEVRKRAGKRISKSLLNKSIVICPHCSYQSRSRAVMTRLHFDNCDPIIQLTLDHKFVAQFSSIEDASKQTSTNVSGITAAINYKQKTAGGFKWLHKSKTSL